MDNDIRPATAGVSARRACCPAAAPSEHRDIAITAELPFRGRKIVHDGAWSKGRRDQASANAV
jgi:hypothetical protein